MPLRAFQVDAFTDRPFTGNPAAVVLLDGPAPDDWLAAVARETGLPATAFVTPPGDDGARGLRWFTANGELALCGHATLATSHVLFAEEGRSGTLRYATGAGPLTARSVGGAIELDFPSYAASPTPGDADVVAAALYPDGAVPKVETLRGGLDLLAVVASADDVRRASFADGDALAALETRCIIVTAPADEEGADVVCRVYASAVGRFEDPVTGSAHCLLGPYWAGRLGLDVVRSHQVSARGGRVEVEPRGDRVALRGRAVTVFHIQLAEDLLR